MRAVIGKNLKITAKQNSKYILRLFNLRGKLKIVKFDIGGKL